MYDHQSSWMFSIPTVNSIGKDKMTETKLNIPLTIKLMYIHPKRIFNPPESRYTNPRSRASHSPLQPIRIPHLSTLQPSSPPYPKQEPLKPYSITGISHLHPPIRTSSAHKTHLYHGNLFLHKFTFPTTNSASHFKSPSISDSRLPRLQRPSTPQ